MTWTLHQSQQMRCLQHSSLQLPHIGHAWLLKPQSGSLLLQSNLAQMPVQEQRQCLSAISGAIGAPNICCLKQEHGTQVVEAISGMSNCIGSGDALFSTTNGVALMVLHADCLPILIAHRRQALICAIHAGWRGLMDGVIVKAVETVLAQGAAAQDLVAVIGPHLGPTSAEFKAYKEYFPQWAWHYHLGDNRFPLGKIARDQLLSLGLQSDSIAVSPLDTALEPQLLYSFRARTDRIHNETTGACDAAIVVRSAAVLWVLDRRLP